MIGGGCVSGVSVERVCDWWRVLCECCGWVWRGYVIVGECVSTCKKEGTV